MVNRKALNKNQEKIVNEVGLFPHEWEEVFEDEIYLHIVRKNKNPSEVKIIDKKEKPSASRKANQKTHFNYSRKEIL